MKKLFHCLLFTGLLISADFVIGEALYKFYYTCKYGIFGRQVYCINKSHEDILILGSSRASHHYVPSIISDSLHQSCYNAGSDGMCIFYHYGLLSTYKEKMPRMILYDFNPLDILVSKGNTFTLEAAKDRLAPHLGITQEVDSLFSLKHPTDEWIYQCKMLRFNSKLVQLFKCNYIPSDEDNGYESIDTLHTIGAEVEWEVDEKIDNEEVDSMKVVYLHKLIHFVEAAGVKLIFVISPEYDNSNSVAYSIFTAMAEKHFIRVINMRNEKSLMKPDLFADKMHLNDKGARMFTRALVHLLKSEKAPS